MRREDRRKAIIEAVAPLLLEKGAGITTAEIARAAGVAEGTIFRAFSDKAEVIHEAAVSIFDPQPTCEAIASMDDSLPLTDKLSLAAGLLLDRFDRVVTLAEALRSAPKLSHQNHKDGHRYAAEANARISVSLARIFEGRESELRVSPDIAVAAFRGLVWAAGNPMVAPEDRLPIGELIPILMSGIGRTE